MRQERLDLGPNPEQRQETTGLSAGCDVVPVGKRRDGGTRYWCRTHRADATAKYGKPANECKRPTTMYQADEVVERLDLDAYPGGVALWGAVPPIYDTTCFPMERGIHVHARRDVGGPKVMDRSFARLRLASSKLGSEGVVVSEVDAIYFMCTAVFGYEMRYVRCTFCDHPHLDKDFFSVHPHRRHLCASCGRHFTDSVRGIGNPICAVREACGVVTNPPMKVNRPLKLRQSDYAGGIQIWGTNPAILWTGEKPEEEGIHVHAYDKLFGKPSVDETYSEVEIDGIVLDALMVRTLMAQQALPSLRGRLASTECGNCGEPHFDSGEASFVPSMKRACEHCDVPITHRGRYRNVVLNPLLKQLEQLAGLAVRPPQFHDLGLSPETL